MSRSSITSAASLGVRIVTPKIASSQKRRPPRAANERDDDLTEQAPPPPGLGKVLDKSI